MSPHGVVLVLLGVMVVVTVVWAVLPSREGRARRPHGGADGVAVTVRALRAASDADRAPYYPKPRQTSPAPDGRRLPDPPGGGVGE